MSATRYDVTLSQSSRWKLRLELERQDTGEPIDLNGADVYLQIRGPAKPGEQQGDLLADLSDHVFVDPVDSNAIRIDAPAESLDGMTTRSGNYDIFIDKFGGWRPIWGRVVIRPARTEVTDDE